MNRGAVIVALAATDTPADNLTPLPQACAA
jgi:hypothetical protein